MAVNLALAVGTVFIMNVTYQLQPDQMTAIGITNASASNQILLFFGGNTTLLIAVLVSLFVGGEFSNGTIKNIAARNYSRSEIYLSKLITSIIAGIVFTLLFVLAATITGTILWGFEGQSLSFWGKTLTCALIDLLLVSAYTSIFVMFGILIRQNGGALAANICFLQFTSLVVILGEMLLKKITGKTILLSNYLPDSNILALCQNPGKDVLIRSTCVGIGFLGVAAIVGVWSFSRRDIK